MYLPKNIYIYIAAAAAAATIAAAAAIQQGRPMVFYHISMCPKQMVKNLIYTQPSPIQNITNK